MKSTGLNSRFSDLINSNLPYSVHGEDIPHYNPCLRSWPVNIIIWPFRFNGRPQSKEDSYVIR